MDTGHLPHQEVSRRFTWENILPNHDLETCVLLHLLREGIRGQGFLKTQSLVPPVPSNLICTVGQYERHIPATSSCLTSRPFLDHIYHLEMKSSVKIYRKIFKFYNDIISAIFLTL